MVSRRMSDDKPHLNTEDILGLFGALDEKTALGNLPSFVALDLSRVPPFNTGELDMTMLMIRVANLESRMAGIVGECVTAVQDQLRQAPSASVVASTIIRLSDKSVPSTDSDELHRLPLKLTAGCQCQGIITLSHTLTIQNLSDIERVDAFKLLGIYVSSDLSWNNHMT